MSLFFDSDFRTFLGEPKESETDWGQEWRFSVTKENLKTHAAMLHETLYHHHSFFDMYAEIADLGYARSAKALKKLYSGNPTDRKTQMGNLGEVIGTHISKAYLGFQGASIYPKRFNTNVEQSMKGIDVLSFRDQNSPAEIFIGEVKTSKRFYKTGTEDKKSPIEDAYETLCRHYNNNELPKMLHFARAYFQGDKLNLENIERHMKKNTPKKYVLLSITEQKPGTPFENIPEYINQYGKVEGLIAIHVEMKGLAEFIESIYTGF